MASYDDNLYLSINWYKGIWIIPHKNPLFFLGILLIIIGIQFISESLLLSFIGGVLGIILGIFATALYTTLREWTLVIPGYVVLGGIVSSILIGGLAGFYPALRAANMSPTDALRTK